MRSYLKHYMNGERVESDGGTTYQVIDSATKQPCTEITLGTSADVDRAVAAARTAFETWSQTSVEERKAVLTRIMARYEKIQALIQAAIDEGTTLVTGGLGRPDGRNSGFFIQPTLFTDVTSDMRIAREETFGPVATITTYDAIDEGVRIANDTEYGLSATISGDPAEAAKVAARLRAGLVTINRRSPDIAAPFGSYKQSRNGRENGKYGLTDFMELKAVVGPPA